MPVWQPLGLPANLESFRLVLGLLATHVCKQNNLSSEALLPVALWGTRRRVSELLLLRPNDASLALFA